MDLSRIFESIIADGFECTKHGKCTYIVSQRTSDTKHKPKLFCAECLCDALEKLGIKCFVELK